MSPEGRNRPIVAYLGTTIHKGENTMIKTTIEKLLNHHRIEHDCPDYRIGEFLRTTVEYQFPGWYSLDWDGYQATREYAAFKQGEFATYARIKIQ